MITQTTLKARKIAELEAVAGLQTAVLFIVRLYAHGPVHIETAIESLINEVSRVRAIKRKSPNKRVGVPRLRRYA